MGARLNGHESDVIQLGRGASQSNSDQLDTAGSTLRSTHFHANSGLSEAC